VPREVADLLVRHIARPCCRSPVPWVLRRATPAERATWIADAGLPLLVVNRLFARRFRAREELLFGRPVS
jgi:hypothetical protein